MKAAVVVGGLSGIGAAVVELQRSQGMNVVVWDVGKSADIRCDISDPTQVEVAANETLQRIGAPAQLTITAGMGHAGMLLDAPASDWDRVMGVNAKGVWLAMRALAGPMMNAGGSIVVTSSVSGQLADRSMGLYCASKAALDMLVKVAAQEWAPKIRVNAVGPGVTDTRMLGTAPRDGAWLSAVARKTAMRRLGTAAEVAEAIWATHAMSWVTGQIILADGGLSRASPIDPAGAH